MRRRAALAAAVALLAACAAPRPRPAAPPPARPVPIPLTAVGPEGHTHVPGVTHVVRRGETVYRIARTYGLDPAELMETNGITDPRSVAVGTELFVPGATKVLEVPPPGAPWPAAAPRTPPPAKGAAAAEKAPTPPPRATASARAVAAALDPEPVPAPAHHAVLAWPVKGVLYGRYGVRQGQRHDGIDIAAPEGTVVTAAAPGMVIYAGEQAGYGSIVIVRHDSGLVTLYAHASRLLVEEGQRVEQGAPVARVGQTGRTTGPHLHFEVREGTRPRNPLLFLP